MIDPKAPKLSQLPLGQKIGKSLRPLLTTSKRSMSTGTFYKTMKAKFAKVMPEKMAKAAAIRYSVGTDEGLSDKKAKLAMNEINNEIGLAGAYKSGSTVKLSKAVHDYRANVSANAHPEDVPEVEHAEAAMQEDPKVARAKAHEAEREAKLHDERVAHLEEKNKDVTTSISHVGKTETKSVSSVAHVGETKTEAVTSVTHLNSVQKPAVTSVAHIEKKPEPGAVVPTGHRLPTAHASVLDLPEDEQQHPTPVQFDDEIKKEAEHEAPPMQLD